MGSSASHVKPKTIKLAFAAYLLGTEHLGIRAKTGWLGIRIMCPSGATCLCADYQNPTKRVGLEQNMSLLSTQQL